MEMRQALQPSIWGQEDNKLCVCECVHACATSMEQIPYCEIDSQGSSGILRNPKVQDLLERPDRPLFIFASQEIVLRLRNQKINYLLHKSLPLEPILSHIPVVHIWKPILVITLSSIFGSAK